MTKAKVLDPNGETNGDDARIQCDFCGATYNLKTGEPVQKEGGKLLGFLFSKSDDVSLPVYGLGEQGGKVFINFHKLGEREREKQKQKKKKKGLANCRVRVSIRE